MSMLYNHGMQRRDVRASSYGAKVVRQSSIVAMLWWASACGGGDDPIAVGSVTVSPTTASVTVNGTSQLAASVLDANGAVIPGRPVTWSTSNASIATISTGGVVTGVATGSATITATSGGKEGTATITVLPPPVAALRITPAAPSVVETRTLQLGTVLKSSDSTVLTGRAVTWTSATASVATVSNAGLVTGVIPGTSVITATSEGKSATTTLTVTQSPCAISLALPIVSGTQVNGTLATTDCRLSDDTYLDAYRFTVPAVTNIEVVLSSTAFDAYLFLVPEVVVDPDEDIYQNDNDERGGTTNARLVGPVPAGINYILANSINVGGLGAYTLNFTAPYTGAVTNPNLRNTNPSSSVQLERLSPAEARKLFDQIRRRKKL